MTVTAALLSLMASAGAPTGPGLPPSLSHPGLDPGPMNTVPGMVSNSVFMGPGLRRDD
jgi:hypothetical protein